MAGVGNLMWPFTPNTMGYILHHCLIFGVHFSLTWSTRLLALDRAYSGLQQNNINSYISAIETGVDLFSDSLRTEKDIAQFKATYSSYEDLQWQEAANEVSKMELKDIFTMDEHSDKQSHDYTPVIEIQLKKPM